MVRDGDRRMKRQSGFFALELLAILIILATGVGAGYEQAKSTQRAGMCIGGIDSAARY